MDLEDPLPKPWYTSKTLWANTGVIIGALGSLATGEATLAEVLPVLGTAIGNLVLRIITKSPVTLVKPGPTK